MADILRMRKTQVFYRHILLKLSTLLRSSSVIQNLLHDTTKFITYNELYK